MRRQLGVAESVTHKAMINYAREWANSGNSSLKSAERTLNRWLSGQEISLGERISFYYDKDKLCLATMALAPERKQRENFYRQYQSAMKFADELFGELKRQSPERGPICVA